MVGGAVRVVSFHEPGVLEGYPQLDHAQCMRELKLVHDDGRVEGGSRALAGALRLSPRWRWLAAVLGAAGVRGAADLGYRAIARLRYLAMGRCRPEGTCTAHAPVPAPGDRRGSPAGPSPRRGEGERRPRDPAMPQGEARPAPPPSP
jgi:predicted DCC family thiol-disulfide oxidoreductase YuxK